MDGESLNIAAEIPPFLISIWEWLKLDWLWILRALVEISALAVGIYYICLLYTSDAADD